LTWFTGLIGHHRDRSLANSVKHDILLLVARNEFYLLT